MYAAVLLIMSLAALVRSATAAAAAVPRSRKQLCTSSGFVVSTSSGGRSMAHRPICAFVQPKASIRRNVRRKREMQYNAYEYHQQPPRYRFDRQQRTPFSTVTTLSLSEDPQISSSSTSASSAGHIFDVGDRVELAVDGVLRQGVITETRGSGWFTVRLTDTDEIVKKRRGQLRYVDTDGRTSASNSAVAALEEHEEELVEMPTIVDLDDALQGRANPAEPSAISDIELSQASHHAKYDKWIVFSDLHCSPSSVATCLDVLSTVHNEAIKHNAGIIFLGDFWHHRGTVRIDTLNAVLRALSSWTVPLIMIPGNHDQVTLGGLEHGLTPLGNAYYVHGSTEEGGTTTMHPGPLIFTRPTKFRHALFVPYIRDSRILQHVLESSASVSSVAQFVHVDVTGAYMNDLIVSQGGVPLSLFPADNPIYSGHFHKPHTVTAPKAAPGVAVRYVGSPYQTSLSEAGQEKELLVLDASRGWELVDTIPLSVGKRYHRIFSASQLLDLDRVAAKDRVVVSMTRDDLDGAKREKSNDDGSVSPFDAKVKQLRKLGASVEIRETKVAPLWPIGAHGSEGGDLEDMTPESTLKAFLEQEKRRGTVDEDIAEELLLAGVSLVEGLSNNQDDADAARGNRYHANGVSLEFTSVTAKGFGPFLDSVTYPLSDRGLVLLRGNNQDDGSDSNGSGKTTLAMAVLWALTGSSDPRPTQDSKVSDVINFDGKSARVAVEGCINGVPFKVTRIKTTSKGSLAFNLDNEDLTRQSIKDTQTVIDERLGISTQILARTIFHGQHAINGLLEATDATLKDELSLLVPLSIWKDAASFARKSHRSHSKRMSELDGMLSVREQDRDALMQRCRSAKQSADAYRQLFETRRKQVEDRLRSLETSSAAITVNETDIEEFRRNLAAAASHVSDLESSLERLRGTGDKDIRELRFEVDSKVSDSRVIADDVQQKERSLDRVAIDLERAREKLGDLQSMWGITNVTDTDAHRLELPLTCPTCGQTIKDGEENHSHYKLASEVSGDLKKALQLVEKTEAQYSTLQEVAAEKVKEQTKREQELDAMRLGLAEKERVWTDKMKAAELALKSRRDDFAALSNGLQKAEQAYREATVLESTENAAKAEINSLENDSISSAAAYDALAHDVRQMEDVIRQLGEDRANAERSSRTLIRLAEIFGPRGVQSFVLQNAVQALSSFSQVYLDLLSDDTLKLELTLDTGDRISRTAYIRSPDGSWIDRPLSSLSGGQWRRCSLALSLGFTDLVANQRNIRSSLLVLDEPLTHLDATGRAQVGKILRRLLQKTDVSDTETANNKLTTIIMILQDLAAEELEESFDSIDVVIRDDGISRVVVD